MYYRRYSSPSNVNVYDLMKQNWKNHNNVVNKDFGIFSSYADAVSRQNPWKFCNYNDPGIGFPRDCGKTGGVGGQWNSWTRGGQAVAYYVEGEGDGSSPFVVSLGAKNGAKGGRYEFRVVKASSTSGKYQDIMIKECSKYGMKPVCDHPHYCKSDSKALYIGQTHHIAYPGHRNNNGYFPSNWNTVARKWDGLCSYTAHHGAPRALCNVPSNTHSWQYAKDQPKFVCGKVAGAASWKLGLSKGRYGNKDIGHGEFNKLFANSPNKIVKRVCSGCRSEYKEMYYRRYSSPSNVNVYDLMKQNWKNHNNVVNKDFGVFSTYADAVAKRNPWKFCNYNDPGIGFPRDCGKTGGVGGQWNSWTRGGQDVQYYVGG